MSQKESSQNHADVIEELESRIRILENENRLLIERLEENDVSYADVLSSVDNVSVALYDPNQGSRIKKIEVTDKVANVFL
ncbi:MAG: hypothetical protein LIO96_09515 [Lachnospiraceae bacterium]|nr:hypothetical protein [Lachnospiraceae bacterium]